MDIENMKLALFAVPLVLSLTACTGVRAPDALVVGSVTKDLSGDHTEHMNLKGGVEYGAYSITVEENDRLRPTQTYKLDRDVVQYGGFTGKLGVAVKDARKGYDYNIEPVATAAYRYGAVEVSVNSEEQAAVGLVLDLDN